MRAYEMQRLGRLADVRVSNVDKKTVDGKRRVRLCNYVDVYKNTEINAAMDFMEATASPQQINSFRLRVGDCVITKDSEAPDDIGVPAFVANSEDDLVCGYHLAIATPATDRIHPKFLHWALESAVVRSQWEQLATGVTRYGLRSDDIKRAAIPSPPMDEQRLIADYLDTETARIDALIATKKRLAEELDSACMSVITDGVSGRFTSQLLEPTAVPWLERKGQGWREAKLNLIAELGTGHTPSRMHPEWWVDCTIPWITTGEVVQMRSDRIESIGQTRENISLAGIANSSAVVHQQGTVVLCRTASAGYSAIMAVPMATSQDFAAWTCGPLLRPRFLLLCLRAMRQDLLGRLAMGSTHKTIYMPDIESLRVVLPSVDEQDEILERVWTRLRRLHEAADRLDDQLALLAERRQALITAAVTGKFTVPGAAA